MNTQYRETNKSDVYTIKYFIKTTKCSIIVDDRNDAVYNDDDIQPSHYGN